MIGMTSLTQMNPVKQPQKLNQPSFKGNDDLKDLNPDRNLMNLTPRGTFEAGTGNPLASLGIGMPPLTLDLAQIETAIKQAADIAQKRATGIKENLPEEVKTLKPTIVAPLLTRMVEVTDLMKGALGEGADPVQQKLLQESVKEAEIINTVLDAHKADPENGLHNKLIELAGQSENNQDRVVGLLMVLQPAQFQAMQSITYDKDGFAEIRMFDLMHEEGHQG